MSDRSIVINQLACKHLVGDAGNPGNFGWDVGFGLLQGAIHSGQTNHRVPEIVRNRTLGELDR